MLEATFVPVPPFMVQCHRAGQHTQWYTDSRHDDLRLAIGAAALLERQHKRIVKIIDQENRVMYRTKPPAGAGLCKSCRKRPAKVDDVLCQYCRRAARAAVPAKPIPDERKCATCGERWAQDGRNCRSCARTGGDDRSVADLQSELARRDYKRGAFCPIRPYAARIVKVKDEFGREVEMVVVWDGRV